MVPLIIRDSSSSRYPASCSTRMDLKPQIGRGGFASEQNIGVTRLAVSENP